MAKKKFDSIIRKKLTELNVPAQPTHWEALQQQLDKQAAPIRDEGADALADQILSHKLQRITVPAKQWPALEQKIRQQAILRDRVFFYKTLETTLLLFFIVLIWQWNPRPLGSLPIAGSPPQAASEKLARASHSRNHSRLQEQLTAQSSFDLPDDTDDPVVSGTHEDGRTGNTEPRASRVDKPVPMLDLTQIPAVALRVTPQEETNPHGELPHNPTLFRHLPDHSGQLPALAALQYVLLPSLHEESEGEAFALKPLRKKTFLNVAMLGGADFNRVMTPPDYQFRIKGFDRYTPGYSGGFLFGLERGRVELGAGLVYAAKQYQPLPVIFIKGNFRDGYVGESLQTVQLNLINLPFYLRYDALRKDKWRAYISGGASLQVAFEANYFITPPTSAPPDLDQTPAVQSKLRNRTEGWFEGGAFKENSYVTANLSIGVERFVSEKWGVFLQPTYHQSIGYFSNGLGPNLDRIHTLSVWTGIRVRVLD